MMRADCPYEIEVSALSLDDLKQQWREVWRLDVPSKISRIMLEKSLVFKLKEKDGLGLLPDQQAHLDRLVKTYQQDKTSTKALQIKAGTRLVRTWKGTPYAVLVKADGYEFEGQVFKSLSVIAKTITGTSWNGWRFFGLKGAS